MAKTEETEALLPPEEDTPPLSFKRKIHQITDMCGRMAKKSHGGLPYKTVSFDDVLATVKPSMHAFGVISYVHSLKYVQNGNRTECYLTMRFEDLDSDDYRDIPAFGFGVDNSDKGAGKAQTYAMKYAYRAMFQLESEDDPDTLPEQNTLSGAQNAPSGGFQDSFPPKAPDGAEPF